MCILAKESLTRGESKITSAATGKSAWQAIDARNAERPSGGRIRVQDIRDLIVRRRAVGRRSFPFRSKQSR